MESYPHRMLARSVLLEHVLYESIVSSMLESAGERRLAICFSKESPTSTRALRPRSRLSTEGHVFSSLGTWHVGMHSLCRVARGPGGDSAHNAPYTSCAYTGLRMESMRTSGCRIQAPRPPPRGIPQGRSSDPKARWTSQVGGAFDTIGGLGREELFVRVRRPAQATVAMC